MDTIFKRLDVNLDGMLDYNELNAFLVLSEGLSLDLKVFDWLVNSFDSIQNSALSLKGFKTAQTYLYSQMHSSRRNESIYSDISNFGFDRNLNLISARSVNFSIHSERNFEMKAMDYDTSAVNAAISLTVEKR